MNKQECFPQGPQLQIMVGALSAVDISPGRSQLFYPFCSFCALWEEGALLKVETGAEVV